MTTDKLSHVLRLLAELASREHLSARALVEIRRHDGVLLSHSYEHFSPPPAEAPTEADQEQDKPEKAPRKGATRLTEKGPKLDRSKVREIRRKLREGVPNIQLSK